MSIATCPKCREQVTVPGGVSPEVKVRCPLCQEEYSLAAALDRLPPMLIVVGAAEIVAKPAMAGAAIGSDHETESHPDFSADYLDDEFAHDGEPGALAEHEDLPLHDELPPHDELPGPDDLPVHDDLLDERSLEHEATPDSALAIAESPAFPRFESPPIGSAVETPAVVGRPRRRRRQAGPITTMIQVLGGGALGLIMAQLILWYMPGNWPNSNRDPLGLAKTVVKFAPFIVPEQLKNPPVAIASNSGTTTPESKPAPKPTKKRGPFELTEPNLDPNSSDLTSSSDSATDQSSTPPIDLSDPSLDSAFAESSKQKSKSASNTKTPASEDHEKEMPAVVSSDPQANAKRNDEPNAKPALATDEGKDPFDVGPETKSRPNGDSSKTEASKGDPASDPAKATVPSAEKPGLRNAPVIEAADLAQRFADMESAATTWDHADKSNREETLKVLEQFYSATARVGEGLLGIKRDDASLTEMVSQGEQKVKEVAATLDRMKFLAGFAAMWLDKKDRSHEGMLIVGTVISHQPRGKIHEMRIKLSARGEREVNVVGPSSLAESLPPQSRAMVLGVLVADPKASIVGYEGESTPVLYESIHIALPNE